MLPFKTDLYVAWSRVLGFPIFIQPYLELAQISLFVLHVYVHKPPRSDDLFQLSQAWLSVLFKTKFISWLRKNRWATHSLLNPPAPRPHQWFLAFSMCILNYPRAKVFSEP